MDPQEKQSILDYVSCLNDPNKNFESLVLSFRKDHDACFLLVNAGTKASEHEGISAAGSDPEARRWTPALDAEALVLGKTISAGSLPVSPRGIVSPVVISRACLGLLNMEVKIIDCGSFHKARLAAINISDQVAECPSTGLAMPADLVYELFKRGLQLGDELACNRTHLVLAECVPGGTTTAMALLTALGYEVRDLLSSSLPSCNHQERWKLVQEGLSKSNYSISEMQSQALLAVSAFGDPMQACISGIAIAASAKIPIYLAGGSQMLAVWALIKALGERKLSGVAPRNIMVMSTKWVAHDQNAGVLKLVRLLDAPFAVSCPDFYQSGKPGLRAYEEGNVKEGVGAGASMCLARIAGFTAKTIMKSIDICYDELLAPDPVY